MNNQVGRCAEKYSYLGHLDSDFNVFHMKSNLGRQGLFWDLKIKIWVCRSWDTKKTVRQYFKERRKNEVRRCVENSSYPGHQDSDFNFLHIKSKLGRQAFFWDSKIRMSIHRSWDTKKTVNKYRKEGRKNQAQRCAEKCSHPGHLDWVLNVFHIKSKLWRQALFWEFKI